MIARNTLHLLALVAVLAMTGCERKAVLLTPVPPITDPIVFTDDFGPGVDYQAFLGSKVDAVSIDTNESFGGSASLRVAIPGPGDPSGGYAGGAFTANLQRDLSGNDALTFWAKSSVDATLNTAGLGNDNTGNSLFTAEWANIPLTTTWTKYAVPIPLPTKLTDERGLFFFAEGHEGSAYTIWFDEVRFEKIGTISNPRPAITPQQPVQAFVGAVVEIQGTRTVFDVGGSDQTIAHMPGYFTFQSSNDTVAAVVGSEIRLVGTGSAVITAKLGTVDATGSVSVVASAPPPDAAPNPPHPAGDVISLFSNSYSNQNVDTWSATWDVADVSDLQINGNDTKVYTGLSFAGVEFTSPTIDASTMTHFSIDVWIPSGTTFRVKLVDFGANGVFDGAGSDDREHELIFNAGTTPQLLPGQWSRLDVPFADFVNLTTRAHLAQMVLSGASTAFIDNVYFHR